MKKDHTFPKVVCPKVNMRLKFENAYNDVAVKPVCHYAMRAGFGSLLI